MTRTTHRLFPFVIFAALALSASIRAAEPSIAVLRAESIDAVIDDLRRLTQPFNVEFTDEQVLQAVLGPLGVTNTDWIDRSRPLALAFPMSGMSMGPRGLVAALPRLTDRSANDVLAALNGGLAAEPEADGLLTLGEGTEKKALLPLKGYMIVGAAPSLVRGFDLRAALDAAGFPAGNLVLDVDVATVRPMAQMGLGMGRQMLTQQLARPGAAAAGAPEAAPRDVAAGESAAADTRGITSMLGLYFDLLGDVLNNTDRMQISLELSGGNGIVHLRLIPRGASTLEGLLKAQKGGLPGLAGHVDVDGSVAAWAGQIRFTPAFSEALRSYAGRYTEAMKDVGRAMDDADTGTWIQGVAESMADSVEPWMECIRGDFAGALHMEAEGGFQMTQLMGAGDADHCRTVFTGMLRAMGRVPTGPDGEAGLKLTENAFQYRDVTATRQEMRFVMPGDGADAAGREMMQTLFGGDSVISYFGMSGDLVLSVTGSQAERRLKRLIDALSARKSTPGLSAETFAPLQVGAGFFGFVDVARIVESFGGTDQAPALAGLAAAGGRVVAGARFDTQGLNLELALPLELLTVMGQTLGAVASGP